MPDEQPDPSDSRWREAMAPLGQSDPPSTDLEQRVRASLASGSSATRDPASRWRLGAVAAILMIAIAALLFRGKSEQSVGPGAEAQQYLLLLYEGASFASGSVSHAELVREYSAWAGRLAAEGKLVEASELEPAEQLTSGRGESTRSPAGAITGFFIVRAGDAAEAAAIAAGCPHLKYGGEVAVRALRVPERRNPA